MKVLVVTNDKLGHFLPALNIAREFKKKGDEVYVVSSEKRRINVEREHLDMIPYEKYCNYSYVRPDIFSLPRIFARYLEETDRIIIGFLRLLTEHKPDLVVYDHITLWARYAADELEIPVVTMSSLLAFNYKVFSKYGLQFEALFGSSPREMLQFPKLLFYANKVSRKLKKTNIF
jgi:UDP:flavonoid glycosyltransferase YjiC (YdhE family)